MKQLYSQYRKTIFGQALRSASMISLSIYAMIRILFYEFPMTWSEESLFFVKCFLSSVFIIATTTVGIAWFYKTVMRLKV